jgi:hypothetical protein
MSEKLSPLSATMKEMMHDAKNVYADTIKNIFGIEPVQRWTESSPHKVLEAIIAEEKEHYAKILRTFVDNAQAMADIPLQAGSNLLAPHWHNNFVSGLDTVSIHCFISHNRPQIYLEIGSGNSTKFAHHSITRHNLHTRIISIDPKPRKEIDAICTQVIRSPLEKADWQTWVAALLPGDIVFFDGSHHCFQNSDATVFFTEILPVIPKNVLIGIHDIFLPYDYPETWKNRFYSEQYLLACWLLANTGKSLRIELPVHWISRAKTATSVYKILDPLWKTLPAEIPHREGAIFWFSKQ